jgi:hypothetical protein
VSGPDPLADAVERFEAWLFFASVASVICAYAIAGIASRILRRWSR